MQGDAASWDAANCEAIDRSSCLRLTENQNEIRQMPTYSMSGFRALPLT